MHVMIATDGTLEPEKTAELVGRLVGDDGQVTVFAVVEVPRHMLEDMRDAARESVDDAVMQANVEYRRDQADPPPITHWAGDQAVVENYVHRKVADRTADLVAALDAAGINHTVVGEEGENAPRAVIEAVDRFGVDVVCVGTHGLGRFEGLLGSLSTKVARLASCSVVLVR